MSEIKAGEYVRYSDGDIQKTQENYIDYFNYVLRNGERLEDGERKIVKHSPNIIDLIEEGDYVNGYRVVYVDNIEDGEGNENLCVFVEEVQNCIEKEDIKSILTKEQFQSMEYRLEE